MSPRDLNKITNRIRMIRQIEDFLPSGWVVNYESTDLQRLSIEAPNKKAVRFLCEKTDEKKEIVLFNGMLKKRKNLPPDKVNEANKLQDEFRKGEGSVEDF